MDNWVEIAWLIPRILYWIITLPWRLNGIDMPHIGP
jgi:hypothetical protein